MIRFVLAACLSFAISFSSSDARVQGQSQNSSSKDVAEKRAEGVRYFEQGNVRRGYPLLRPLADTGDPAALSWVGWVLARSYFQKALTKSGTQLGIYVEKKFFGLPQDPTKGLALLHQSANVDHPLALYFLAVLYLAGEGVDKDEKRSREYVHRAANLGNLAAQIQMGLQLIKADPAESYKWYFIFSHCGKLGAKGNKKAYWDKWRLVWLENDESRKLFIPEGKKLIAAWEEKHGKLCLEP